MDLNLNPSLGVAYTSRSQVARVVTESWVAEQLYCPACNHEALTPTAPGTKVIDFQCETCEETFQLKSQSHPFGSRVTDAAYGPMMERIKEGTVPTFVFLHYRSDRWLVRDLFFVPRYFLSSSAIEQRRALALTARRAGWVGCNILLSSLPSDARIHVVSDEVALPSQGVRASWNRFSFLDNSNSESRGWMADVLHCVRDLSRDSFSLTDLYAFEGRLAGLHPRNLNVRPKIRQQLQVLRDHGVLEFEGNGRYRVLLQPRPPTE